jgi:hypothetical protein
MRKQSTNGAHSAAQAWQFIRSDRGQKMIKNVPRQEPLFAPDRKRLIPQILNLPWQEQQKPKRSASGGHIRTAAIHQLISITADCVLLRAATMNLSAALLLRLIPHPP